MLTGLHLLLTYMCNLECDHCFVYSAPDARGTFTFDHLREALDEAVKIGTIEWIYFEGGEAFLFYPVMIEGIRIARRKGFKVGVVTNAYFATTEKDAELWLAPIGELGISDLGISDDSFHYGDEKDDPAKRALAAAKRLGLPASLLCIEKPTLKGGKDRMPIKGAPVTGGGAMLRGRAVEKLAGGLPRMPWKKFTECPYEDLKDPKRVHLDSYGNVQLCQGLSMGNMQKTPLSTLVNEYDATSHPICGPLTRGGPALLAREYDVEHEEAYVDACHCCYLVRRALVDRFPQYLAPRQAYGLEPCPASPKRAGKGGSARMGRKRNDKNK